MPHNNPSQTAPPGVEDEEWDQWVDKNPLRQWRHAHSKSIMQTASTIGVTMTTVQQWERGVTIPSSENMDRIIEVTGKNVRSVWARWINRKPVG